LRCSRCRGAPAAWAARRAAGMGAARICGASLANIFMAAARPAPRSDKVEEALRCKEPDGSQSVLKLPGEGRSAGAVDESGGGKEAGLQYNAPLLLLPKRAHI